MYEHVYEYGSEAKIVLVHVLVHSNLSKFDAFALRKEVAAIDAAWISMHDEAT